MKVHVVRSEADLDPDTETWQTQNAAHLREGLDQPATSSYDMAESRSIN